MKYYCIKQHDITDCGAACLATICRQNGYKIGISKIREVAGTDKQGTNAYGVIKAAEQLGFSAKGVKGDREAFFSEFPLPCIAHVIVDGGLLHYVVIHKITKKTVVIADRHPFGHLIAHLGLDCVAAFPGCSSETSASFETQTKLIEAVKSGKLSYIFVIEGSDRKVAEVVAAETGAEILTLNSMQVVSDYESLDYIAVMRSNLENLKKALQ